MGSEFQRNVWQTLQEIPYGMTVSYGNIAARIAKPSAVRAVGTAIGRNPIAIIIPCHRVIGQNGCSGSFSGKLHVKKTLLDLERVEGWETGASSTPLPIWNFKCHQND